MNRAFQESSESETLPLHFKILGFAAMGMEDDLLALIDLIYEASFDSTLWPTALISLADTMRTAHIGLSAMDFRAQTYEFDCPAYRSVMTAIYRQYWAFHNPVWHSARRGQPARYICSIA